MSFKKYLSLHDNLGGTKYIAFLKATPDVMAINNYTVKEHVKININSG